RRTGSSFTALRLTPLKLQCGQSHQGVVMSKFLIEGGVTLSGEIEVAANKNAVLPMMSACLLTDDDCYIDNVPAIADVATMASILQDLGATVEPLDKNRLR